MKKWAIIVAGGSGLRMGHSIPKQFLPLDGRPLLQHTLTAFFQAYADMQVVLVMPADFMHLGEQWLQSDFAGKKIILTAGGSTRFDSVKNGLVHTGHEGMIFVHDGVRCLVTPGLIQRCYEKAVTVGAVVPAIMATDSIRLRHSADSVFAGKLAAAPTSNTEEPSPETWVLDRKRVLLVQTPQTFYAHWLHKAFELPYQEHFTDEATVVEQTGRQVCVIEGEEANIKVTRPVDLLIAQQYLAQRHSP